MTMEKLYAHCGMDCAACEAYIASKNNNAELRAKVAEKWSRMFESGFEPEDIDCAGCTNTSGPHVAYCMECAVRRCCQEKVLPNCAYCEDYPCAKLNVHLEFVAPGARETLDKIRGDLCPS